MQRARVQADRTADPDVMLGTVPLPLASAGPSTVEWPATADKQEPIDGEAPGVVIESIEDGYAAMRRYEELAREAIKKAAGRRMDRGGR